MKRSTGWYGWLVWRGDNQEPDALGLRTVLAAGALEDDVVRDGALHLKDFLAHSDVDGVEAALVAPCKVHLDEEFPLFMYHGYVFNEPYNKCEAPMVE